MPFRNREEQAINGTETMANSTAVAALSSRKKACRRGKQLMLRLSRSGPEQCFWPAMMNSVRMQYDKGAE